MTRIGIIGNGNVGSALEKGFKDHGHDVKSVGKQPDRVKEVADWAETIVLAVPFAERDHAFKEMGKGVKGKTIIDVTNALDKNSEFAGSTKQSGAEELQRRHRDAQIVKAFNTVFAEHMGDGQAAGETLSLFVAADDEKARSRVMALGKDLGFDPVDAGGLENARWLETLGYLNITLGHKLGQGTETGFRYVHRAPGTGEREAVPAGLRR